MLDHTVSLKDAMSAVAAVLAVIVMTFCCSLKWWREQCGLRAWVWLWWACSVQKKKNKHKKTHIAVGEEELQAWTPDKAFSELKGRAWKPYRFHPCPDWMAHSSLCSPLRGSRTLCACLKMLTYHWYIFAHIHTIGYAWLEIMCMLSNRV